MTRPKIDLSLGVLYWVLCTCVSLDSSRHIALLQMLWM